MEKCQDLRDRWEGPISWLVTALSWESLESPCLRPTFLFPCFEPKAIGLDTELKETDSNHMKLTWVSKPVLNTGSIMHMLFKSMTAKQGCVLCLTERLH